MTIQHCIKCHQYGNEDSMCLVLHDIVYTSEKVISKFEKKYLNTFHGVIIYHLTTRSQGEWSW